MGAWLVGLGLAACSNEEPAASDVPVPSDPSDTAASETATSEFAATVTLTSDFERPHGRGDHAGTEGPWTRRILGARSVDGLTWVKTGVVISDQADVPDLVVDARGILYLYYYGWTVGPYQNRPALAMSSDGGASWHFRFLVFDGFPGRGDVGDPHVVTGSRTSRGT